MSSVTSQQKGRADRESGVRRESRLGFAPPPAPDAPNTPSSARTRSPLASPTRGGSVGPSSMPPRPRPPNQSV